MSAYDALDTNTPLQFVYEGRQLPALLHGRHDERRDGVCGPPRPTLAGRALSASPAAPLALTAPPSPAGPRRSTGEKVASTAAPYKGPGSVPFTPPRVGTTKGKVSALSTRSPRQAGKPASKDPWFMWARTLTRTKRSVF